MKYVLFPELSKLIASNCGIAILNPGWIHPSRKLETSVLILGKKSRVEITEGQEFLSVEPDKFTILSAGQSHFGTKKITEPSSYYWMHFSTVAQPELIQTDDAMRIITDRQRFRSTLSDALLLPQEIPVAASKVFLDQFHDLLFEQEHPSFTAQKFQFLFRLMLVNLNERILSEYVHEKYDATRFNLIHAAIQTVFENYTDGNFSVKTLSDRMKYNPDYLNHVFKARMGKSLSDYIIDQRIKNAVCLLVESNNTIGSIAYDCGFNSTRNFLRQFKARKGETPSELRLRHRTMHLNNR